LKALLAEAEATVGSRAATAPAQTTTPARPARVEVREDEPTSTAHAIERMIDDGADADEIARRLGVPVAEVRLVMGLQAARAARRRVAGRETSTHA
jgi:hypothetical protein